MDTRIGFKQVMYVYSLEDVTNPTSLKVALPDVFLDKGHSSIETTKINKGNTSIYKNRIPPALTSVITDKNYIVLPVIGNFLGSTDVLGTNIRDEGSTLIISSSDSTNYSINSGIGKVSIGDKLIAFFINEVPTNGIIVGRC